MSMSCKHDSTSLVEMDSKEGPFLTVQCDVCGQCLPDVPIDGATFDAWYERRLAVPRMDFPAYCAAVDVGVRDVLRGTVAQLERLVKVARSRGGKR